MRPRLPGALLLAAFAVLAAPACASAQHPDQQARHPVDQRREVRPAHLHHRRLRARHGR